MPLAIVGAGSLGQSFAGLLAASGQPVTLLGTPASVDRLGSAGELRLRGQITHDVPVSAPPAVSGSVALTADASRLPAGAGVIFLTKGQDLASAIEAVRPAWPGSADDAAWVTGFQNGLAKDDLLARAFGPARLVGGVTILGAQRQADGSVSVTSLGKTYLGESAGGSSARVDRAVAALLAAGIPTEAAPDIRSVLWSKACNAAGVFGFSVLTRISAARMAGNPWLIRAYLSLVRETASIASAYGVEVGDYTGFPIATYVGRSDEATIAALTAQTTPSAAYGPSSLPSMTQDLLAGRSLEVEAVFGDLLERAAQVQLAVPRLELATNLIRALNPETGPVSATDRR
jgi:2-dehydropantoate 2-reductase